MTLNEYQELAQRTSNKELTQFQHLKNGIYGLNGEAGEVIDILKKHEMQGHELDVDGLIDEGSDILWYCAELASGLGITLDDIAEHNVNKLRKRYPDGFDADRSIHRVEANE